MSLGAVVRRFLGPGLASRAGQYYRAIYVDLAKLAEALAAVIPRGAHVLDVGAGDGLPLNHLLALRPDLTITMLDTAPVIGQWIDVCYDARVTRFPKTSLTEFVARPDASPDVILMADVIHHIPEDKRYEFLNSIKVLLERTQTVRIIVKDVEPGHWRSLLGLLSDRYVTGDRNVRLVSKINVIRLFEAVFGPLRCEETSLFKKDRPNYAIVFRR